MTSRIGSPSAVIRGKEYNLHWGDQFLTMVNGDGKRLKVYNGRLASAMGHQSLESLLEREMQHQPFK